MIDKELEECRKVTRVEVIDSHLGRVYVTGSYDTVVQLQDDGITLKVFIDGRPYSSVYTGKDIDK